MRGAEVISVGWLVSVGLNISVGRAAKALHDDNIISRAAGKITLLMVFIFSLFYRWRTLRLVRFRIDDSLCAEPDSFMALAQSVCRWLPPQVRTPCRAL